MTGMTGATIVENVTCLGCGCACDDIGVVVRDARIVEARNACALGIRWFGDGRTTTSCRVDGRDASFEDAVSSAISLLRDATRPLVYLAPAISTDAQREATAIADLLRARLDSVTSTTTADFVLAGQELGLASATLGEIRNRADVVVFWGIDIEHRYPRFTSRYAPEPVSMHLPTGRRSRTVIAVDVGAAIATVEADHGVELDPRAELMALAALEALVRGGPDTRDRYSSLSAPAPAWRTARELAPRLLAGRYVAIVYDAEPDERATRSPQRFAALASVAQSLNDRTRCAAVALRAGGNRSGADTVLSAQTGFPFAVDFSRGFPRYDPFEGNALTLLHQGEVDATLVVGEVARIPEPVVQELRDARSVVIGPRATAATLGAGSIAIDTGIDGIHAAGTGLRADDVPLPLRAVVPSVRGTLEVLGAISDGLLRVPRAFSMAGAVATGRASP
jgi:formylmethanofuran dehydrogenase subunit B